MKSNLQFLRTSSVYRYDLFLNKVTEKGYQVNYKGFGIFLIKKVPTKESTHYIQAPESYYKDYTFFTNQLIEVYESKSNDTVLSTNDLITKDFKLSLVNILIFIMLFITLFDSKDTSFFSNTYLNTIMQLSMLLSLILNFNYLIQLSKVLKGIEPYILIDKKVLLRDNIKLFLLCIILITVILQSFL